MYEAIRAFAEVTDRRFTKIESLMVTKDYLDEKLWDLRGDLNALVIHAIGKHEVKFHGI